MDKNYDKKMQFLSYAITDISNYIRFLDTKMALIMAFSGVIITATVGLRKEILIILNASSCPMSVFGYMFVILMIASAICMLICGFLTMILRQGYLSYKSKWFFLTNAENLDDGYKHYCKDVLEMSDEDIVCNMAAELYKLMDIYLRKSHYAKIAVYAFAVYVFSTLAIFFSIAAMGK